MKFRKTFISILLVAAFFMSACVYIVLPEGVEMSSGGGKGENLGWMGLVTKVSEDNDSLRIDITIRNDTGQWSTLRAVEGKPAVLKTDGGTKQCNTVMVGTGGHRLAPGFQMRGYVVKEVDQIVTQLLYVECAGAKATPGATLTIETLRFDGEFDKFVEVEETNKINTKIELNLDNVVTDLTYPVATPVNDLILPADTPITGLSDNVITLLDVQRSADGFQFTWQNTNPTSFALKTHIGYPPVIGEDGIIYGPFVTWDLPDVPLTSAGGSATWTTEVAIPQDIGGLYILLGVESLKPKTYLFYVLDITDR
jgi:hypothetical protein